MRYLNATTWHSPAALPAVICAAAMLLDLGAALPAVADDPPAPPASPEAPPQGGHDHRNDPAWQACKKQADAQNLERGPARREFMQNCLKSSKETPPPAPAH